MLVELAMAREKRNVNRVASLITRKAKAINSSTMKANRYEKIDVEGLTSIFTELDGHKSREIFTNLHLLQK